MKEQSTRATLGLTGAALAIFGILQRRSALGPTWIGLGSAIAASALIPKKAVQAALPRQVEAEHVMTIMRPASELFAFWRKLENCAQWMQDVQSVRETGPRTSHWEVTGPAGVKFAYDAEIIEEVAGEKIVWQSSAGSALDLWGYASFKSIGERGTEVRVRIRYGVPVGMAGALAAFVGHEPTAMLKEDLRRFRQLTEAGEIATNRGCARWRNAPKTEVGTFAKHTIDAAQALKHTHAVQTGGMR